MVRALWTAASGMTSQQLNVDTISNNLANVNTVGYKKETIDFKSLLYQKIDEPAVPGVQEPTSLQVGHGVRVGSMNKIHTQGILQTTGNATDLAIQGDGFFTVTDGQDILYTRDGSFQFSVIEQDLMGLTTSEGYPVLSVDGEPIQIDDTIPMDRVSIDSTGLVQYLDEESGLMMEIAQMGVVQFSNPAGLDAAGSNMFMATEVAGVPRYESEDDTIKRSQIKAGYLEGSNVAVAEEMVNLIVAQRAYELNSTAIQTVDTMLQQANELKRS